MRDEKTRARPTAKPRSAGLTFTLCAIAFALTAAPATLAQGAATAAGPRCPAVTVACPAEPVTPGEPVTFTAQVSGEEAGRLSFKWEVSAGQIVTGQGTPSVFVDTTGANGVGVVEATVEVGGLSVSCPKTASCAAPLRIVNVCNKPLDEYGNIRFEDEQARLDNFAIAVSNEPDAQGYLFCYGGRRGRAGEAQARCERARNYLVNHRGIDAGRVVTVDAGFREELTVTLYVVPAGAEPPAAYPTVDPAEVEFIEPTPARTRRPARQRRAPARPKRAEEASPPPRLN